MFVFCFSRPGLYSSDLLSVSIGLLKHRRGRKRRKRTMTAVCIFCGASVERAEPGCVEVSFKFSSRLDIFADTLVDGYSQYFFSPAADFHFCFWHLGGSNFRRNRPNVQTLLTATTLYMYIPACTYRRRYTFSSIGVAEVGLGKMCRAQHFFCPVRFRNTSCFLSLVLRRARSAITAV